jgi:hypothetical protein
VLVGLGLHAERFGHAHIVPAQPVPFRETVGCDVASIAMTDERTKVVTDPLGRSKRRHNLAAIHQADDESALERRRDEAVAQMREVRAAFERELRDLGGDEAFSGEECAALHVLWHLGGTHTHIEAARRIVEDGVTDLDERDTEAEVGDAKHRVLRNIDEYISYASALSREQLATHARRGNRDYYVVGMVESTADHIFDHLEHVRQIRAELKERSGTA